MNKESKIKVSVGCADFLVEEIERLRLENKILGAQIHIVDNFFGMINRLGPAPTQGYGEDRLWQAKKEIKAAQDRLDIEAMPRAAD